MIRKFTFLRGLLLTLQNKIKKKEMLTGGRPGTPLTYQSRRGVGTWLVPVGRNNPPVKKRQEGFLQRVENLRRAALVKRECHPNLFGSLGWLKLRLEF